MDRDTKAAIKELTKTVKDGFAAADKRFTSIDKRFAAVESRMENGFASLEARMEKGFAAVAEDIQQMVTKDDLREALKPIEDRLTSVDSKVAGTNRRLDNEAMLRDDLAIPRRISDLEEKTFGATRHPKHVPLN